VVIKYRIKPRVFRTIERNERISRGRGCRSRDPVRTIFRSSGIGVRYRGVLYRPVLSPLRGTRGVKAHTNPRCRSNVGVFYPTMCVDSITRLFPRFSRSYSCVPPVCIERNNCFNFVPPPKKKIRQKYLLLYTWILNALFLYIDSSCHLCLITIYY
jgi:hypothetical protein